MFAFRCFHHFFPCFFSIKFQINKSCVVCSVLVIIGMISFFFRAYVLSLKKSIIYTEFVMALYQCYLNSFVLPSLNLFMPVAIESADDPPLVLYYYYKWFSFYLMGFKFLQSSTTIPFYSCDHLATFWW
ncbi:hypothetical protein KFK09_013492 [Dendrobium nobile]|uniref:Uncharacterized protein n=1 Tax=Dendrobium nobile TaxID=94219 RepID=A0A8T3BD74_DENNO|nr:hypothetical protein KFK09_013492 [Dendrobium nobile]